jgi:phosphatidylethanolamine-binding protein (PEBP) family uncharacterized protein
MASDRGPVWDIWYLFAMAIEVSSPAFEQGSVIPTRHTGEGQDVSLTLNWSGLPQGTREIALVCDDPDVPRPEPGSLGGL